MNEFSVRDCAWYLEHLAHISVHRQMVLASGDVHNQFGILLLRRGTPLGALAADKMRGHRLALPVDDVLRLRRGLDSAALASAFLEFLDSEPDLRLVNEHFRFEGRVRHLCHTIAWRPALLQQLSVMQLALPRVFHRALFCAWLGSLIASERRLDAREIALVFQAGLFHDLGLLHIDPALAEKRSDIAAAEWQQIQSHVQIGAAVLAAFDAGPERLQTIVAQHHERVDGAGYPEAAMGAELDPLAPIVALGDMIHALRFPKRLLDRGTLADCMPYLRVNRRGFGEQNDHAASRILLCAREPAADASRRALRHPPAHDLIAANRALVAMLGMLRGLDAPLAALAGQRAADSTLNLVAQVRWVAQSSGLGSDAAEPFLEQSLADEAQAQDLYDIAATMQEVFWLLRRLERGLRELLQAGLAQPAGELARVAEELGHELGRAWQHLETRASESTA